MSDSSQSSPSSHLEPPQKGPELEDPGAQESGTSLPHALVLFVTHSSATIASEDDHFSDASEGEADTRSRKSSRAASPVPITRVERVDDEPRHGEVPGTSAYDKRTLDAVPDEVEIVPEGSRSRSSSRVAEPTSPGGTPIPRTMVVRVDESPSYGEVPGTEAYDKRKADAVPDLVLKTHGDEQTPSELHTEDSDQSVPETRLFRVDSLPKEPGSPGLHAHRRSPSDALPDVIETVHDTTGKPDIY